MLDTLTWCCRYRMLLGLLQQPKNNNIMNELIGHANSSVPFIPTFLEHSAHVNLDSLIDVVCVCVAPRRI